MMPVDNNAKSQYQCTMIQWIKPTILKNGHFHKNLTQNGEPQRYS